MPGLLEIGIIVLVLLLGARKLPELACALGSSLKGFKRGREEGESKDATSEPRMNERKNRKDKSHGAA